MINEHHQRFKDEKFVFRDLKRKIMRKVFLRSCKFNARSAFNYSCLVADKSLHNFLGNSLCLTKNYNVQSQLSETISNFQQIYRSI